MPVDILVENINKQNSTSFYSENSTTDKDLFAGKRIERLFPDNKIEKILLIVPPNGDSSIFNYKTAVSNRYENYPPYGLGLIATYMDKEGSQSKILNLHNEIITAAKKCKTEDAFNFSNELDVLVSDSIKNFQPNLVIVTTMFSQTHQSALDLCLRIKDLDKTIPIAAGGVHFSNSFTDMYTRNHLLNDVKMIDFIFLKESELAFRDFVKYVKEPKNPSYLSQVVMLDAEIGEYVYFDNDNTPEPCDLNVIPKYEQMDIHGINNNGTIGKFYFLKNKDDVFATILNNRGCRGRCTFCSVLNFNGSGVRQRKPHSILDEIKILQDKYNVTHFMWLDDDPFANKEETMNLFNAMVRENINITWDCSNGAIAAPLTDEIISGASDAGCIALNIGMESGNPEILRSIKKPGRVGQFLRAAEVLRRYPNIMSDVYIMIGFPGESLSHMLDTINVCKEMNLDWYNVNTLAPLPNTPIFNDIFEPTLESTANDDDPFQGISFSGGSYGKANLANTRRDLLSSDFKDMFSGDLNRIPDKEELDKIWAYMNYFLNFAKLHDENRPEKIEQQYRNVRNICTIVAPENAIAQYFYGILSFKKFGYIDPAIINKIDIIINTNNYWKERFDDFGLSINDLMKYPLAPLH